MVRISINQLQKFPESKETTRLWRPQVIVGGKKVTGLSAEITTGYLPDTRQTYYRNRTTLPNQDEWQDTRRKRNAGHVLTSKTFSQERFNILREQHGYVKTQTSARTNTD